MQSNKVRQINQITHGGFQRVSGVKVSYTISTIEFDYGGI